MTSTPGQRKGRPTASRARATRERILEVARVVFAEHGYGPTTNKDVADRAGITAGALYYYFDSKLDMFLAVFAETQSLIDSRMKERASTETTFSGRVRALLRAAQEINVADPGVALFHAAARMDRIRHPEIRRAIAHPPGEGTAIVDDLIALGSATGEIEPGSEDDVAAVLRVILLGLMASVADDHLGQRTTVEGLCRLLDGNLLRPPAQPGT